MQRNDKNLLRTHKENNDMIFYLIFVHVILELCLSQLVERDNDESDKNVDKEEGEDDKEHNVENGHLHPEPGQGTLIVIRRRHGVL